MLEELEEEFMEVDFHLRYLEEVSESKLSNNQN